MSTTTFTYPSVIRVRRVLVVGLIAILILASLAPIAGSILGILSSTTRHGYEADRIPVVQNSIIPVSVPTPPTAEIQPVLSKTSAPTATTGELSVVPVPVPTAPS